jgi:integrase
MIRMGWCRTYINAQMGRLRRLFKWAAENELVPAVVHHCLSAVSGLRAGRTSARESKPVKPVSEEHIAAVLPYLSRQIAAMVRVQLLCGMRPGEVCEMRGTDIDASGELWFYRPRGRACRISENPLMSRLSPPTT